MKTNATPISSRSTGSAAIWTTLSDRLSALIGRVGLGADKPFRFDAQFQQTRDGVTKPLADSANARYWVLARSLYRVRTIALPKMDGRQTHAAIKLELSSWSPFAHCDYYVILQPGGALLFAWDANVVAAARDAAAANSTLVTVPETALRELTSASNASGVVLHQTLDGVEARKTSTDRIETTQWWPTPPDQRDWQNFLRVAGTSSDAVTAQTPLMPALPWRRRPTGYSGNAVAHQGNEREWLWIAVASWFLCIPTIWLVNEWRQLYVAKQDAQSRLAATERDLEGVLTARSSALTSQARAQLLSKLFATPDLTLLSAQVLELLGSVANPQTFQLTDWEWRERKLRFVMQINSGSTPPAATLLVKAFEKMPVYADVKVNADGNRIVVEFVVASPATNVDTKSASAAGAKEAKP